MAVYGGYPSLEGINKILIIKLRNIGDVLLTTPVFHVLKNKFPEAKIDAYINKESFPLLENNPYISRCILYDRSKKKEPFIFRLYYEFLLLQEIKREKYDLVINLTEGDRGKIAAKVSKAPIRVGLQDQKKAYTHIVKNCPTPRHTVEKNLDALRKIGIHPPFEDRNLFLPICSKALQKMKKKLAERKITSFLLLHPTARWRFKCWPEEKWHALSKSLIEEGHTLVFTSGKEDWEINMVENITRFLPKQAVVNLSGKVSLEELAALLQLSTLLFCVDSAPFHMASALQKKVVALFGPSSPLLWGPWRNPFAKVVTQDFSCRPCLMDGCAGSKKSDCLETLSEDRVLQEAKSLLEMALTY